MATFGGIPFKRKKAAVLADEVVQPIFNARTELVLPAPGGSVRDLRIHGWVCKSITSASSPT